MSSWLKYAGITQLGVRDRGAGAPDCSFEVLILLIERAEQPLVARRRDVVEFRFNN
ncbi:hypothetical protein [Microbacterium foliorum]|uniref:hypothetical protein n=1 Tax=Microbacterium foliorum TaxID=104336 RepID=UPI001E4F560A|nr:hypothetical protein [Microbacterium foliorum]